MSTLVVEAIQRLLEPIRKVHEAPLFLFVEYLDAHEKADPIMNSSLTNKFLPLDILITTLEGFIERTEFLMQALNAEVENEASRIVALAVKVRDSDKASCSLSSHPNIVHETIGDSNESEKKWVEHNSYWLQDQIDRAKDLLKRAKVLE